MTSPTFPTDALLADRFRVVRFVARGGMGEVYEAEDLKLHERVALKTVGAEIAQDERALERLLQEVHLARQVTHANVCRIFDVFQHRPEAGGASAGEATFVTMELLAGETLADRLARAGRLTTAEALPIVRQVVAGLAAAHKAGVIHRDLKTENVTLVPSAAEEGGVRAVVTDFGLAQARAKEGGDASLAELGLIVGTPAYMAPEQIEARGVTAASDIYALGVVTYEMVTGRLPFPGETMAAAARRLTERPTPPREHVRDLDERWEAVILRCLERDPIDRFASVADVAKALEGQDVEPGLRDRIEQRARIARGRRRWLGLGLAMLLGAGVAVLRRPPAGPSPPTAAPAPRRSVAVLGFKSLSGQADAAWLSTALSEMLTTELAAGETLRILPGESVARAKVELNVPDADALAQDTLARLRKNLGSDLVVLGSYFAAGREAGGAVRLDLRLQEAAAGETVAFISELGREAELPALVSRVGARLRRALGVPDVSAAREAGVKVALPASPEAARLYAEGLSRLRLFDALAARDLLQKSVAADASPPLAHSALAAAWSALGYDAHAKDEAKKALDLSASLAREDRLLVEARYREAAREWEKAVETYRALWGFFPDNLDYGLRLAAAQISAGKGGEALATVEALRKLARLAPDGPRIDLAEAQAAESLSEFKRCQAVAARAAQRGAAHGARLLVAQARIQEGRALLRLGKPDKASAAAHEAKRIFGEVGDRAGVARALDLSAAVLDANGKHDEARAAYEEALAISREIGDKFGMAWELSTLAMTFHSHGDLIRAREMYDQSLAIKREIDDTRGVAVLLNNIANALKQQGELADAKAKYGEALAIARGIGDKDNAAWPLQNLGDALLLQGDLGGAQAKYEEALAIRREIGHRSGAAFSLHGMGDVLLARGDLAGAGNKYREALAIRAELGEEGTAAGTRLALAELSLEEGDGARAEALARAAAEEFRKEGLSSDRAWAQAVVALGLLRQAKATEALEVMRQAMSVSGRSANLLLRLSGAIAGARIRAANGEPSKAFRSLSDALAEATRRGLVGLQYQARLAMGEVEMRYGDDASGHARLKALETEASARGFGLIARKAASVR